MKKLVIQRSWCKGCGICAAFCPKKVLALNPLEGKVHAEAPEACIYCRLCELRCPDLAITVVEESGVASGALPDGTEASAVCGSSAAKPAKA